MSVSLVNICWYCIHYELCIFL